MDHHGVREKDKSKVVGMIEYIFTDLFTSTGLSEYDIENVTWCIETPVSPEQNRELLRLFNE